MKWILCPLCHIKMTEVSKIVEEGKKQLPKDDSSLTLYNNAFEGQYHLFVDQGLPTERRYKFFECLGCGLVLMFNQDKLK